MPRASIGQHQIHYALQGPDDAPAIVFVNGLTQYLQLWTVYAARLSERGFRVLSYDMLGQGGSSKPVLSITLDDHVRVLAGLMIGMFVTPVFYPAGAYPRQFVLLLYPNPMAQLIGIYQSLLLNQQVPAVSSMMYAAVTAAIALVVGSSVFAHNRRTFAALV